MSFKNLWVSVSIVAVAMLPVDQISAWFMGVGHLPSCAYICLDRSMSLQSSCQDLKCICKQPNLVAANKDCFSKECDLNSLSKALKLIAACQESFGITPTPAVESKPAAPPSLQPPTGYIGYPYMTIPPTPEQSPSAPYYAYPYPGPRVVAPISNSAGVALPPGTTVPPVGSSPPAAAPQPQVQPQVVAPPVQASATPTPSPVNSTQASAPTTQASAPAPQGSFPKSQTPAPIGGANNGTWNSSGPNPAASASNASSLSASNASASRTAGDSAWGSAPSLLRHQVNSPLCLLAISSTIFAYFGLI